MTAKKPTANPPRTVANWMAARPALFLRPPGWTGDEPNVGVGTGPLARFVAVEESAAKPTDGGLKR